MTDMNGVSGSILSRDRQADPLTVELRVHWQFFERTLNGEGSWWGCLKGWEWRVGSGYIEHMCGIDKERIKDLEEGQRPCGLPGSL